MTKAKKTYILQYKYSNRPWVEYDRTKDEGWCEIQHGRMLRDFPGAEYRMLTK